MGRLVIQPGEDRWTTPRLLTGKLSLRTRENAHFPESRHYLSTAWNVGVASKLERG